MAIKTRSSLRKPLITIIYYNSDGSVYSANPYTNSSAVMGSYEYINDQTAAGAFKPGLFRLNPVTIKHGVGSCSSQLFDCTVGSALIWPRPTIYGELGALRGSLNYGTWNAQAASLACAKAHAKINAANVEAGLILGELGETLNLIRHPLKSLVKNLGRLNRARSVRAKIRESVSVTSDEWMKTRYGILPLVSDIHSLKKAFMDETRRKSGVLRSARANEVVKVNDTLLSSYFDISSNFRVRFSTVKHTELVCTAVVYYQHLLDMEARSALSYWGVSPRQALSTAYELVPYSFVVDWFVNMGTWLQAIQPNHEISKIGGCTSQKAVVTTTCSIHSILYYGMGTSWSGGIGTDYTSTTEQLIRTNTAPVSGYPTLNIDPFNNLKRVADSLSMLWQKGKGRL